MTVRYEVRAVIEDMSVPNDAPRMVRYTRPSWYEAHDDLIVEYTLQHRGGANVDMDALTLHSCTVMCVENEA